MVIPKQVVVEHEHKDCSEPCKHRFATNHQIGMLSERIAQGLPEVENLDILEYALASFRGGSLRL